MIYLPLSIVVLMIILNISVIKPNFNILGPNLALIYYPSCESLFLIAVFLAPFNVKMALVT